MGADRGYHLTPGWGYELAHAAKFWLSKTPGDAVKIHGRRQWEVREGIRWIAEILQEIPRSSYLRHKTKTPLAGCGVRAGQVAYSRGVVRSRSFLQAGGLSGQRQKSPRRSSKNQGWC
jgi:hypothetical protein